MQTKIALMENMESVTVCRGTNPLLTVIFFGMIIAGIVTSGSYFSKQRIAARDLEEGLNSQMAPIASLSR